MSNEHKTGKVKLGIATAIAIVAAWAVFSGSKPKEITNKTEAKPIPVTLKTAQKMTFENKLTISGNIEAKNFALVSPRVPGTLDSVYVDEGDFVKSGETKLFQTDSLKLTKAVDIAKQQYEIANCSVKEKKASLERIEADLRRAELDYNRSKKLLKERVISRSQYDNDESVYLQAKASLKHAKVLITLAEEEMKQAKLNLDITQKDLRDSLVIAPITGVVSKRFSEPGEMGIIGQPVLRIEDLSLLEVSVYLPEEYYESIIPDKTIIRVVVGNIPLGERPITYKSPTVSNDLRTFEVKCLIKNPPTGIASGRIARTSIILESRLGLGVPRDAIELRNGKQIIFVCDGKTARGVEIKTGIETDGWLEIIQNANNPTLSEKNHIAYRGQNFLEDGKPIFITGEGK